MTGAWRTRLMLIAAALAALVTVVLAYPKPISTSVLGDGWECRATAFSTSCTKVRPVAPIVHSLGKASISLRRA
jgi:hypothetical protein